MGRYNPNLPYLLGQEWVPINQEGWTPSPVIDAVESGYRFTTTTNYTLTEGRLYTDDWPDGQLLNNPIAVNVYPAGAESLTGPIRRVVIPISSVGATGSGSSATTALRGVFEPADDRVASLENGGTPQGRLDMFFATNSYSQLLQGKRILSVNYLYELDLGSTPTAAGGWATSLIVYLRDAGTGIIVALAGLDANAIGDLAYDRSFDTGDVQVRRLGLGEINSVMGFDASGAVTAQQIWNYAQLQRFEVSAANRLSIFWRSGGINSLGFWGASIGYSALEVFYCEETRLISGARNNQTETLINNTNPVVLKTVTTQTASPSLPAGTYTVTVGPLDLGARAESLAIPFNRAQKLAALRQLYALRGQEGVRVTHPYPLDESADGQTFSREYTDLMVPLSLHTSTGPIPEIHGYNFQVAAQVYGSVTATQEIYDANIGGTFSYPQVRFYARRFGDTTVSLRLSSASPATSGSGMAVLITPDEFDALEPAGGIIDGWKEVTLRFPTAPVMGAGTLPRWDWSAATESSGNRWEIMGTAAMALTGDASSMTPLAQVALTHRLSSTTYGAPVSGAAINLGWVPGISPLVSATTDDNTADAVLIFSQDPPPITGFSIGLQVQPITGIGADCGGAPCCIPTGIPYNRLTWSPPYPIVCDQFGRTTSNGFGTYLPGLTWEVTGSGSWNVSEFSTTGSAAQIAAVSGGNRFAFLQGTSNDLVNYDVTIQASISSLAASSIHNVGIVSRWTGAANHYRHRIQITPSTFTAQVMFDAIVGGSSSITSGITKYVPMDDDSPSFYMRAQGETTPLGSFFRTKWWIVGTDEPDIWDQTVIDNSLSTGAVGVLASQTQAVVTFDDFLALPIGLLGSSYELQRMDDVDSWKTIMSATNLCTQSFNDYESRVTLISQYRIRSVNQYNFAGSWATPVSGMISGPGVSGAPCIGTDGGVLIFTSNEDQDGLYNLAYVPVWDAGSKPTEDFAFPEAGTVTYGRMYNRNNQVAFKPLERGGEAFQRTILVQAAAVSPPRLANIESLQSMAWADLTYVCVRNDIGDRWFASVVVPSERVQRNRTLYFANVVITKVSDDPNPVSP